MQRLPRTGIVGAFSIISLSVSRATSWGGKGHAARVIPTPSPASFGAKRNKILIASLVLFAAGCTTPYAPYVVVNGSRHFPGLVELLRNTPAQPNQKKTLDVLLVHGMCTHTIADLEQRIDQLSTGIKSVAPTLSRELTTIIVPNTAIQLVQETVSIEDGNLQFSGLVWSEITRKLKNELAFDSTGEPKDCSVGSQCKPKRAALNGIFKDGLLDDCLSDVVIYQGKGGHDEMVRQMQAAIRFVAAGHDEPLVIISESLGSKMVFDALADMDSQRKDPKETDRIISRLTQVFMAANQLPLLGLGDEVISAPDSYGLMRAAVPSDSLRKVIQRKRTLVQRSAFRQNTLTLVAFTDPNDLLSYRLLPSQYENEGGVSIADVLVSNQPTYIGALEMPDTAHKTYLSNSDVISLITCGSVKNAPCR